MDLPRYAIIDAYTLEAFRREYQSRDARGRISMLEDLYGDLGDRPLPYEIAILAATDTSAAVPQWLARNGKYLDYRDDEDKRSKNREEGRAKTPSGPSSEPPEAGESPKRNLEAILKNDPDPFVRACLRENPNVFGRIFTLGTDWLRYFDDATHLERLALVRNPSIDWRTKDLLERIFDSEDTTLAISRKEREELILAFLSNTHALGKLAEDAGLRGKMPFDGGIWYDSHNLLKRLWRLGSTWPKETRLQGAIYACLPAEDETKAEIFRNCDVPIWRRIILKNCSARDKKTIRLGFEDPDEFNRYCAYAKVETLDKNEVDAILQREDDAVALSALAENRSLPHEVRMRVMDRMRIVKGGDSQLDLISYHGGEDAELGMAGEDSRGVSIAEDKAQGRVEEKLRTMEARLADIGKQIGYVISAGIVVAIWAFFEFAGANGTCGGKRGANGTQTGGKRDVVALIAFGADGAGSLRYGLPMARGPRLNAPGALLHIRQ